MNPGKIVDPPKMDDRYLFRFKPGYQPIPLKPASTGRTGVVSRRGRDVQQQRRLPEIRPGCDVPVLPGTGTSST